MWMYCCASKYNEEGLHLSFNSIGRFQSYFRDSCRVTRFKLVVPPPFLLQTWETKTEGENKKAHMEKERRKQNRKKKKKIEKMKVNYTLIGDVENKIKELPDKSIQMCITSPPYYDLRNYEKNNKQLVTGFGPPFAIILVTEKTHSPPRSVGQCAGPLI